MSISNESAQISLMTQIQAVIRKVLLPIYKPSQSKLLPSAWRYLLMKPMVFEMWYRLRAYWFLLFGYKGKMKNDHAMDTFMKGVKDYNQAKVWEFYRIRTEKFMALFKCIDAVKREAKILCIGPRNEAEILLLSLYGFSLKNITSIDLFSCSPLISYMDMHNLEFPDNTFDIVYSAWTLKYSYDFPRACTEIVRVLKTGGIVATGFTHTKTMTDEVGTALSNGIDDLMQPFNPNLDWIYWKEISQCTHEAADVSVLFRIKK